MRACLETSPRLPHTQAHQPPREKPSRHHLTQIAVTAMTEWPRREGWQFPDVALWLAGLTTAVWVHLGAVLRVLEAPVHANSIRRGGCSSLGPIPRATCPPASRIREGGQTAGVRSTFRKGVMKMDGGGRG